jgi:hypothetical protein
MGDISDCEYLGYVQMPKYQKVWDEIVLRAMHSSLVSLLRIVPAG